MTRAVKLNAGSARVSIRWLRNCETQGWAALAERRSPKPIMIMQDRALEKLDVMQGAANRGQPDLSSGGEVAVGEQPQSSLRVGEGTEVRLSRLDDEEPLMRPYGRIDQREGETAGDPGRPGRALCTAPLIPWPVRREFELAIPVAHDDPDEILTKGQPFGILPPVEMELPGTIAQGAIACAEDARCHELVEVRRRFAPHKLDAVLQYEIEGPSASRCEERVTVQAAAVRRSDFHGRPQVRSTCHTV